MAEANPHTLSMKLLLVQRMPTTDNLLWLQPKQMPLTASKHSTQAAATYPPLSSMATNYPAAPLAVYNSIPDYLKSYRDLTAAHLLL